MKTATWMLAIALGIGGCDGTMMSDPDRMRSMIDDARLENEAHRDAAAGATTLADMRGEMTRHDAMMDDLMDDMGMAMDGMSHCTGAGMQDLRGMHDDVDGEMTGHRTAMDAATELAAAATEVDRHVGAMHAMLDGMDAATARMGCGM
ncbi:MAG: hypothetical protein K8M05_03765 [Deltaproteobacteria bacterium]|nr:hypothetical protein [Kofleriaceae bacterium]